MWRDKRFLDLVGIEHPIVLAPMAGPGTPELAIAVSQAGGLGSLPCAMLTPAQAREGLNAIRAATDKPFNANFFCHNPPSPGGQAEARWKDRLAPYYDELGLDPAAPVASANRTPFGEEMCGVCEEVRPKVVSFHFGLPDASFIERLKAAGCVVMSSATTVAEARWLADNGADAIIAQGLEAGGHRGMFLTDDLATQLGTMALVPQVVDSVAIPVIAAGGIADGRGMAAALFLGASAVQLGTSYLFSAEAKVSAPYRQVLADAGANHTAITNVMTGRPARGLVNRLIAEQGPINPDAPPFPLAAGAVGPLRTAAEAKGLADFTSCWAGQAVAITPPSTTEEGATEPAGARDLTRDLIAQCRGVVAEGV